MRCNLNARFIHELSGLLEFSFVKQREFKYSLSFVLLLITIMIYKKEKVYSQRQQSVSAKSEPQRKR